MGKLLDEWRKRLRPLLENHALLMALCIGPWIVLGALYALGFSHPLLWPAALAWCIGSHLLMAAAHSGGGKKSCH